VADNPFVYGHVVPATAFVDRQEELNRLAADLAAGQKVFLISPRRYGKTSLVRQAMRALARRGLITLEVAVSQYTSYVAFLEGYTRAMTPEETRLDRVRSWLGEVLSGIRPEVRYEPQSDGAQITVAFPAVRTDRDVSHLAAQVFQLPARIAAARRRRVAVFLDEFQAIDAFNGGSVENALRAAVQHQRDVGYVFAGSEPSLMERMLGPKRPFYKAGPVMRLGKIDPEIFAGFIESRFVRTGIRPEPGLSAAIVEAAGNLPYDVQLLAHEMWDDLHADGRRRAGPDDLHATLKRLLAENATVFETLWQRLTLPQRAALRAVVVEEGREVLAADVRHRHRLGGASSVQAALTALQRQDVIMREGDRYVVADSLLREWVARRTF
jgi:hypothetical protein